MEYVEGRSADDLLKEKGRLPWREATQIVTAAAQGLAAAHRVGVLHRDVKPANILVSNDGRVKVADFGLAKMTQAEEHRGSDAALTASGIILGTPYYMSPEQAEAKTVDARSDLYSLGATYFHLLTGRRPFEGETTIRTLTLLLSAPMPSVREVMPDLPSSVERICAKLMARDPDERPPTAEEAIKLLGRAGEVVPVTRLSPAGPTEGARERAAGAPAPMPKLSAPVRTGTATLKVTTSRAAQGEPHGPVVLSLAIGTALLALVGLGIVRARHRAQAAQVVASASPTPEAVANPPVAAPDPVESPAPEPSESPSPEGDEASRANLALKVPIPEVVVPSDVPLDPASKGSQATSTWTLEQCHDAERKCRDAFLSRERRQVDCRRLIGATTEAIDHAPAEARADLVSLRMIRGACRAICRDHANAHADLIRAGELETESPGYCKLAVLCAAYLADDRDLVASARTDLARFSSLTRAQDALEDAATQHRYPDTRKDPLGLPNDSIIKAFYFFTIRRFATPPAAK